MKKYDNYKDSGIEWIGEIPEHWLISKIKYSDSVIMGQSPLSEDCNSEGIGLPFLQGNAEFGKLNPSPKLYCEKANKKAEPNDILLSVRAPVGAINISNINVGIGRGLCAIRAEKSNYKFIYYYLNFVKEELESISTGSTFKAVNLDDVKNIVFLIIDFKEQTAIANYLDQKTTQIDQLINQKQRFIELLQEERTAVINQAVTKGLDPTVTMKDSGIEWLGEIPEHWDVKPLKHLVNIQGRIGFKGYTVGDLVPEGLGAYTIGAKHINKHNELDLSKPQFISWEKYYESPEIMVNKNDLLLTQRGTLGKVVLINDDIGEATINPSMVLLNKLKANGFFLYYFFNSDYFISWVDLTNTATAVPMINQAQLGNFKIVIPEIHEQEKIVSFIKKSTFKIDEIILKSQQEIELLIEYKTALISEVVTGKVDVREVVLN
jgi:type I restriction enzyme S subunit